LQLMGKSKQIMVETTRDLVGAQALYKNLGFIPKYEYRMLFKKI